MRPTALSVGPEHHPISWEAAGSERGMQDTMRQDRKRPPTALGRIEQPGDRKFRFQPETATLIQGHATARDEVPHETFQPLIYLLLRSLASH